jgi:hypothetical protein
LIQEILDSQRTLIEEKGANKAPVYALVYDDVIGDRDLMKAPQFVKSFIACRHYNLTTFICSQSYTAIPRRCRLQAHNIFYFKGSNSETLLMAEEYSPPGFSKKAFINIIDFCTSGRYDFLHINKRVPFESRYRRNLDEVVEIDRIDQEALAKKKPSALEIRDRIDEGNVAENVNTDPSSFNKAEEEEGETSNQFSSEGNKRSSSKSIPQGETKQSHTDARPLFNTLAKKR